MTKNTATGIDIRKAQLARGLNPNDFDLDLLIAFAAHFSDMDLEDMIDISLEYTAENMRDTLDHPELDLFND